MTVEGWYLVIGLLLLLIAVVGGLVARWPLTTAMIYLGLGALFGHLGWIALDLARDAHWLALASEIAVIVSLFSAGLKLRLPLTSRSWLLPVALATTGMAATAALVASAGVLWLGLPLGAAVLLGAILAPTDPVLAADVKVGHTGDTDPVRLTLTGEAGMNDGTAFPVLMLGLGLLGLHTLGDGAMRWLTLDVLWMVFAGLLVGGTVGAVTAHYTDGDAYNALCDIRALEILIACFADHSDLSTVLCTEDRALALFWSGLQARAFKRNADAVAYTLNPVEELFPGTSGDELQALISGTR